MQQDLLCAEDFGGTNFSQDKSFEDLVSVLKKHFDPKPLVIAE